LSGGLFFLGLLNDQFSDRIIGFSVQIENVDTIFASSSNPLLSRVEGDLVDWGTGVKDSVFFIQIISVPDLEDVFFTSGGNIVAQRSNGEGVNVFLMSLEGVLDQEVGLPDLKSSVPTASGEVGVLGNGGVSDAGDPISVVVVFVGVLAVSKSVPQLETSISTSRDDLSIILGETDSVDFLGVTSEASGGLSGSEIPKTEGLVPGGGQSEQIVRGKGKVRDKVIVTSQRLQGETVESASFSFVDFFSVTGELPDHESLISGTRNEDLGVFVFLKRMAGGNAGNPVSMTFEVTNQSEL